jgi:WD40 repeat protein
LGQPLARTLLFVSYTPADEDWASWIAWELESAGYRVVLQAWDFVPGTNFVDFMDRGVAEAAAVIAVLSRSYLSSRFGRWEWQAAILADPDDPAAKLITVRVQECPLEGLLSTITYVDLVGSQEQQARDMLLSRVRHTLDGRAKPSVRPLYPSVTGPRPVAQPSALLPQEALRQQEISRQRDLERQRSRRRPLTRPEYPPGRRPGADSRDGVAILHVPGPRFGRAAPEPGVPVTATEFQARVWADVSRLADAGAPRPDLLVVTGDLTHSGSVREFDQAATFLAGLRALLGLEPERCVIVPGSHDLTRVACRAYFDDCEADDIEPRAPYWPKWRHFSRVFEEFYRDLDPVAFDRSQPWSLFEVPDLRVVVAGLNSTMAETHRPEDRFGWLGEAQAAWFAEHLRPYAERGWLRVGAVAHDPGLMRDAQATGQLLGSRLSLLLHGTSGRQQATDPGALTFSLPRPGSSGIWQPPLLTVAAGGAGQHEILHLTASGMARWRPGAAMARPQRSTHAWQSASATFPAPASRAPGQAGPGPGNGAGPASLAEGGAWEPPAGEDFGRSASPAGQLLDQIAEVVEAGHPGARVRRLEPADGAPHLLVTHVQDGFARQWRVAAHVGPVTREVIAGFAAQAHSGEPEGGAELIYSGPRPPQVLRSEALRRGIRVRSFTEFQGLLDLRDYVAGQAARLHSDQRYPHSLYVPQRFRDLEAETAGVRENLVEDLLRDLATDAGRFTLVLGEFGRGKTFALRELARHIPARLPHLIPIYVELRELDKAHSVEGLVAAHLANHGEEVIDIRAFRYMLAQGRIVLLFDGFDELATRVTYDRAADHLQTLLSAAEGKAKIIVASRTQHFKSHEQVFTALGERVGLLPGRRVLDIEDFTTDQVRAYLGNLYGEEDAADERLRLIAGIEDLLGLSSNPRMLSFIAALDAGRLRAVAGAGRTISAADLYEVIVDAWLSHEHHRSQGIPGAPLGLSPADLLSAVTMLAMRLNESGEHFIRLDELTEEIARPLAGLAEGELTAQQGAHAIGAASLLARGEDGLFGFIHSSVAEWLVAREIAARLTAGDAVPALERRPLSQLTVEFLCDLATPVTLQRWLEGVLADHEGSDPGDSDPARGNAARANAMRVSARMRIPAHSDLRGAQLQGEDLSHRELGKVDFTGADLTGARLVGANLSQAVLAGARLVRARLDGARLPEADLRGADLAGARLIRADLTGVQLAGSTWSRAALIDVAGLPAGAGALAELRGAAIAPGQPVEAEIAPADIGVPYGFDYTTARLPQPIAYSPDGGLLAIGSADGGVTLCDTDSGLPVRTLRGHASRVYSVTYSARDQVLVTAASDATVRVWDTATGECRHVITVPGQGAWPVEMTPDGELLAYGAPDGVVRLFDVATGTPRLELAGHASLIYTATFAGRYGPVPGQGPAGRELLLTGDRAGAIRMWDLDAGQLVTQFTARGGSVFRLASVGPASGDGSALFAVGGSSGTLLLMDSLGPVAELSGHTGSVYALDFHPERSLLASGDTDGGVRLWDLSGRAAPPAPRATLASHPGAVYGLSFSPDGGQLASACSDGVVRVTSVADGRARRDLMAHRSAVWRPVFRPDGAQLATGSIDGTVRLWDTATGQPRHLLRGHGRRVTSVSFSAAGNLVAARGNDGVVSVWDPATGQQRHALSGVAGQLVSAVFGPSGALLAAASNDGGVYLWNAETGTPEREMNVETERVWAEAFSPEGDVLATANDDDSVRLWYRTTGRETLTITEHRGRVRSLSFSPDGSALATGCDDRLVRVFDTRTGARLAELPGHADRVYAVQFSPDGGLLASIGNDGVAYLWDVAAATAALRIEPGGGKLWTAAFSPSGDALATAGDDGAIRLWSVPDGGALATLAGHADRVTSIAYSPAAPARSPLLASASDDGTVRLWDAGARPGPRLTLIGGAAAWAAFAPDGRYKFSGPLSGQFWHVIGTCRFEPGDLDPYLPAISRLPDDAPF